MADILQGMQNIGGGGLNLNLNLGGMFGILWNAFKWIGIFGLLFFLVYWFFLRPAKYKDVIEVRDITQGGIICRSDRGFWKESKKTGEGHYLLLRDPRARLQHPPLSDAILTSKGRRKYTFVKFGASSFDYASISQNVEEKDTPTLYPLADENWVKHEVKIEAEKKILSGFWNDPAKVSGIIIIITLIIIMIILISFFKAIPDTAAAAASQISSKGSEYVAALDRFTTELHTLTDRLAGAGVPVVEKPPV